LSSVESPAQYADTPPPTAKERRERLKRAPQIAPQTLATLAAQHPTAHCELDHRSPFELIVSVVLSAQTTDVGVNKATPKLFARYPDAKALAAAEPIDVEPYVATLGFFRSKARSIVGLARALVERYGGEVPDTMEDLVKLPGVGRKTANVVLGVLWNKPEGVVVDTHVQRLAQRLGWSKHNEPEKIEVDLCAILPRSEWDHTGHVLIFHGRRCCYARKPDCPGCSVNGVCPAAFDAEHVGRKEARHRVPARARELPRQVEPKKTVAKKAEKTKKAQKATPARAKR
jgi:endonuclease-3